MGIKIGGSGSTEIGFTPNRQTERLIAETVGNPMGALGRLGRALGIGGRGEQPAAAPQQASQQAPATAPQAAAVQPAAAAATAQTMTPLQMAAMNGGRITLGGDGAVTVQPAVPTARIEGAELAPAAAAVAAPAVSAPVAAPAAPIAAPIAAGATMNLAQMSAGLGNFDALSAAEQANLRGSYDSLSDADKTKFLNNAEQAGFNSLNLVTGSGDIRRSAAAEQLGQQLANFDEAAPAAADHAVDAVAEVSQTNELASSPTALDLNQLMGPAPSTSTPGMG